MLLAMLLMAPTVFADVSVTLTNPSFEEPGGTGVIDNWSLIPGWSCSDTNSGITDEDTASHGSFNAWCYDGGAWVEQITDHTILAGVTYTLKVDAIAWANANCRLQVQVRAGTSIIAEFDETNTVHPTWTEKTLQFTADAYAGQLLKIRFRNSVTLDDCAGADNFRLTYTSPDSDPPTPNPSTWLQLPTATSASSIAMAATTASDPSGVEYFFEETTGNPGGTDSGWQSSASYTDIGLSPNTIYTYRVRTRDLLANTGSYSTSESATTPPTGGDWIPIISDDFESGWGNWIDGGTDAIRYTGGTYAYQGNCAIDLQDDTATSVMTTGNLNLSAYSELRVDFWYYPVSFDNAAEDFWLQISTDGGLNFTTVEEWNFTDEFVNDDFYGGDCPFLAGPFTSNTQLRFRCDASGDADDVYIDVVDVYGSIGTDTDPPTPNPSTWSQVPIELGSNSITMTATEAYDPHSVEYYFECVSGGGHDSGWQTSPSYTDTGLSPQTTYTYRVRTRDLLANTGSYSTSKSATTTASEGVYPMSDPNNTGNWVLRSDLSDEFEGATLDEVKWWRDGENDVYMYEWPGRAPAQFDPDNIRVENGRLKIAREWDPSFDFWPTKDPDCNCWYGDPPITQAALISNNTFRYGYMEVKIKAADECTTSSFWFTGDNSELDVFEMVGDSKVYPDTDYMFEFCVHDWAQGGDGWCDGVELGWRVADNFHVYACEWDSSGLKFYADGVLVRDAPSSVIEPYWCLDEQMMLWLDSELFEWHGVPTESELPIDFEIEYVRVWQH